MLLHVCDILILKEIFFNKEMKELHTKNTHLLAKVNWINLYVFKIKVLQVSQEMHFSAFSLFYIKNLQKKKLQEKV